MTREETIAKLEKFRLVDKYTAFMELQPAVIFSTYDHREIINDILNACSRDLLQLYRPTELKPKKSLMKKAFVSCMTEITKASVSTEDKEFAYDICWRLAEMIGADMRRNTGNRKWGYKKGGSN
ncbi:MAG: hypothetical protein JSS96_12750 [Bacteroidetes bacterium]|nr:hypothetical protein [Bacteroidota bacterium]